MIELVFVACFTVTVQSTPVCRQHNLLFVDISLITCMIGAQQQLALWIEAHPGHRIRKWHCRSRRPGEKDT